MQMIIWSHIWTVKFVQTANLVWFVNIFDCGKLEKMLVESIVQ